ncbi:Sec7 domain-containing protein [Schizosaccharomyces cryophilus OY26]|uniref:Sec7 domain-containing protein n=1 Tax=Schizosaccharomyces cryophilus (strain OY26 / ATCC MYA-4695 / CBS 11777 / NBRC 106824 / NRRL Y48691) TaxID=653667 RepID=S9W5F8_SCHCR|nr:Sec7 domain-containing protein [Schizosaccharomyces cryophilus OY26]EPY53175.1 Sec7 domain-containing protein [Schizosaccharomyces cryophilus OY26]
MVESDQEAAGTASHTSDNESKLNNQAKEKNAALPAETKNEKSSDTLEIEHKNNIVSNEHSLDTKLKKTKETNSDEVGNDDNIRTEEDQPKAEFNGSVNGEDNEQHSSELNKEEIEDNPNVTSKNADPKGPVPEENEDQFRNERETVDTTEEISKYEFKESPPEQSNQPVKTPEVNNGEEESESQSEAVSNLTRKSIATSDYQKQSTEAKRLPFQNSGKLNPHLFIIDAFKQMSKAKSLKKHKKLRESIENVQVELQKQPFLLPETILEPLVMACETNSATLLTITLDCFAKLIDYNYFDSPAINSPEMSLMERVVNTIASCFFGDSTPEKVQLQIVKALLAAVTSQRTLIRHSSLLMAVRQTYNIFLLCKNPTIQSTAQVAIMQMVDSVFNRLSNVLHQQEEANAAIPPKSTVEQTLMPDPNPVLPADPPQSKLTLESFEQRKSFDQVREEAPLEGETVEQQLLRDAFLLVRALCKLSIKPVPYENDYDLKSHSMRSKLMSLHLIYRILYNHMDVFSNAGIMIKSPSSPPTPLIHAVKQYICLSLAKNVVSHVLPVFEISCEVFWLVLSDLKNVMKAELEVFFTEIFFPILEMRSSSNQQKIVLLNVFHRICKEPRTLIELYLNYDCISGNTENVYERIIVTLARIASQKTVEPPSGFSFKPEHAVTDRVGFVYNDLKDLPQLSVSFIGNYSHLHDPPFFDYQIKLKSYKCLNSALSSLYSWCNQNFDSSDSSAHDNLDNSTSNKLDESQRSVSDISSIRNNDASTDNIDTSTTLALDDPSQFESLKHHKKLLQEGIQKFNYKPKQGMRFLLSRHMIESDSASDIASFLLDTEGLNKAAIGEFLGEGNEENVAIMHAFVDKMSFKDVGFVNALRSFLQRFRLPGEAQKIDRFMLKFAEKYVDDNLGAFRNADTAYVLAYSIIMLNTDQHSPQVKQRMTCQDFIRNNRGVDDGGNLSDDFLADVYDDIQKNEIIMKDEQGASIYNDFPTHASLGFAANISNALATVGRDLQREAYYVASNEMANKTEALFRDLLKEQKQKGKLTANDIYYTARHFEHVGPMFEAVWMPILAAFSESLQLSSDTTLIQLSLGGFRLAVDIICFFSMDLPRNAFIQTLTKFTHLNNISELQRTNMDALRALLDISLTHGNQLKDSWKDILLCISQLERVQLITAGVDKNSIPDINSAKLMRHSVDKEHRSSRSGSVSYRSTSTTSAKPPSLEIAKEYSSREVVMAVDKVFSNTRTLGSEGIYDFVKALIEVSWEEIECSLELATPRLFSLQKLVEISYYNMGRIRMEWSSIWSLLGNYFTQVSSHENSVIASFALDSLRQFSMQFLEIEELSHFKFQKDFLQPFKHAMDCQDVKINDLVLRCVDQMVKARFQNIKSGWGPIFQILTSASKIHNVSILQYALSIISTIYNDHSRCIFLQGAYSEMVMCLSKFSQLNGNQKFCLVSLDMLKNLEGHVVEYCESENLLAFSSKSEKLYWYTLLLAYKDVIKEAPDLEVRSRAVKLLFNCLDRRVVDFDTDFLNKLSLDIVLSIFSILSISNFQRLYLAKNTEETDVWILTTMVEALRAFIEVFTRHMEKLRSLLPNVLSLLQKCICQENNMLSKVGISCCVQLIQKNRKQFNGSDWDEVIHCIDELLKRTLPIELQDHSLYPQTGTEPTDEEVESASIFSFESSNLTKQGKSKKQQLKNIVVKCTLQLLMINCLWELTHFDNILSDIPKEKALILLDLLSESWKFAESFNSDIEIRAKILSSGIVDHMPNLLSQEASCAKLFLFISFQSIASLRRYGDNEPDFEKFSNAFQQKISDASKLIIRGFQRVIFDNPVKGVAAFQPVITGLVEYIISLEDTQFMRGRKEFYELFCDILACGHIDRALGSSMSKFFKRYAAFQP